MIERVTFTPEADDDVLHAYSWYEDREPGLGEEYLRCVEAGIRSIQRFPEAHRIAVDGFRRVMVRRFPYEIFYEATVDAIVVYGVIHCSQDPQKWRARLSATDE